MNQHWNTWWKVFACWSVLALSVQACSGEVSVSYPGCELCEDRCLTNSETGRGYCVACIKDSQCRADSNSTKVCSKENRCICGSSKDCPNRQVCAGEKGCVDCLSDKDCTSTDRSVCLFNTCQMCKPNDIQECAPTGGKACKKGKQTCNNNGKWGRCEGWLECKSDERCENEKCVPVCNGANSCKLNDKKCITNKGELPGKFLTCVEDKRGCRVWQQEAQAESCPAQYYCDNGECQPFRCPPAPCKEKQTRCLDRNNYQTCVRSALGCLSWAKNAPCAAGQQCVLALKRCAICTPGVEKTCYSGSPQTRGVGVCQSGKQICKADGSGFGSCVGEKLPQKEACNDKDDDCNGVENDNLQGPLCANQKSLCKGARQRCGGVRGWLTCDSSDYKAHNSAYEAKETSCDGQDNDCDGSVDNNLNAPSCAKQKGVCFRSTQVCNGKSGWSTCTDADYLKHSGQYEAKETSCDGQDNDCDGSVDNNLTKKCYTGPAGSSGKGACTSGTQTCSNGSWSKCVGEVLPAKQDTCGNGKDDDCNGLVDESCGWAKQIAGNSVSLDVDSAGNTYVIGKFSGQVIVGTTTLNSRANSEDVWVAKLDPTGKWAWAISIGGTSKDQGFSVVADSKGSLYITGSFVGAMTVGSLKLTAPGKQDDFFLAKLTASGKAVWAQAFGGSGLDQGRSVALDSQGNLYVTGSFQSGMKIGVKTLQSKGKNDIFLASFDSAGKTRWAQSFGGSADDVGSQLSVSQNKNLVVTGYFWGTVSFGSSTVSSQGYSEVFVLKTDLSGNVVWVQASKGKGSNFGNGIASDSKGNVYVVGSYGSFCTFGTRTLRSHNTFLTSPNVFLAMLDSKGQFLWAIAANDNAGFGRSVSVDRSDNVYFVGSFVKKNRFGSTQLSSQGSYDAFVARVTSSGQINWAVSAGSSQRDRALSIANDPSGQLFVGGVFSGTAVFGKTTLTSGGVFVWKIPKP